MENFIFYAVLHLTLTFRTAKNLCPNLQKLPLPANIPGYAPALNYVLRAYLPESFIFNKKQTLSQICQIVFSCIHPHSIIELGILFQILTRRRKFESNDADGFGQRTLVQNIKSYVL